ncbi:MAG: glycoside hydrolase family 68 protein [Pseudomonadota bacterium]|jgi:levansucrase
MTSHWTASHVAAIDPKTTPSTPLFPKPRPLLPGIDLWDYWPVQEEDGSQAIIAGGTLFILLSAPVQLDPDARHGMARLRLMHRTRDRWRDLGLLFEADFSPGSREWSGSAIISPDHGQVTLYYTVAGTRGEDVVSFSQRLFQTQADLIVEGDAIAFSAWSQPTEMLVPDGMHYERDMVGGGAIGTIKAFRDPAFFRDPADDAAYIFFAASLAQSKSFWNGAVGVARRTQDDLWDALPPLISADGVNNELERPHVIVHDGRYYLFWSTQRKVFADNGPAGPNGLYGMTSDRLAGPWRPINGTGLAFANPPEAPFQAYSWFVLPDLTVQSFADVTGLSRLPADPTEARRHFGGSPAPELRLKIQGDRVWLA